MQEPKNVYLIPGLAASSRIFERLDWDEDYRLIPLNWIQPKKTETLSDYALRISQNIEGEKPILVGVSFGGILAQEIAKHIDYEKIVIISSVKSHQEFPLTIRLLEKFRLQRWVALVFYLFLKYTSYLKTIPSLKTRIKIYQRYMGPHSYHYLCWCLKALSHWRQEESIKNLVHIHGDCDSVFPIKYISYVHRVPRGTHLMIILRFRWLNQFIPQLLKTNNL